MVTVHQKCASTNINAEFGKIWARRDVGVAVS